MSLYELLKPNPSEYEFLKNVHHTTMKEHVKKIWGWSDSVQDDFFKKDFESGQIQIIRTFNQSVGYLHLNQENDALHIVNILILPEFQNQKLGSAIIKDLATQSRTSGQLLRLGVFKVNTRAKSLYDSFGFQTYEETETHYLMQLKPV